MKLEVLLDSCLHLTKWSILYVSMFFLTWQYRFNTTDKSGDAPRSTIYLEEINYKAVSYHFSPDWKPISYLANGNMLHAEMV